MASLYQRPSWVVSWSSNGSRTQRTFDTKSEALKFMLNKDLRLIKQGRGRLRTPEQAIAHMSSMTAVSETGCHVWTGPLTTGGYGRFSWTSPGGQRLHNAHRIAYHLHVGPIPGGLVIDHLCRTRNCVNPKHLEAVTQSENLRRGYVANPRMESRSA